MPPLPRGTCPECGAEVALRKGGLLREHRGVPGLALICRGSGKESVERAGERCKHCGRHHERVPEDLCEPARREYDAAGQLGEELGIGDPAGDMYEPFPQDRPDDELDRNALPEP